jgi:glutaredoxin
LKITLFTSKKCVGCQQEKELLQMMGVKFSELTAEGNRAILEALGIESVPTLVIERDDGEEEQIVGFAPSRIKEALNGGKPL